MTRERKESPKYTVEKENGVVWVNGEHNCLGRFSPNGFEIYREMFVNTQVIGTTATLDVRIKNTDEKEWNNFKKLMMQHHHIDLSDVPYPGNETEQ